VGQVIPFSELEALGARLRAEGKRVVFTNGHFDLLHIGHTRYLQAARELGDVLVVGINDDASTRRRKGPSRPIVPAEERAELLAALACVDYATVFSGDTAEDAVRALQPDIYVKGGDYALDEAELAAGKQAWPEAAIVRAAGGQVVTVPLTPGHSTSELVQRIRATAGPGSGEQ